jgi:hypothetical protein
MFRHLARVQFNFLEEFSMKSIKFAAAIGVCACLGTTAFAGEVQSFSALQGVEAQALSSPEMSSVYGQLDRAGLDAAIAARLAGHPVLEARVTTALDTHPVLTGIILKVLTNHGY